MATRGRNWRGKLAGWAAAAALPGETPLPPSVGAARAAVATASRPPTASAATPPVRPRNLLAISRSEWDIGGLLGEGDSACEDSAVAGGVPAACPRARGGGGGPAPGRWVGFWAMRRRGGARGAGWRGAGYFFAMKRRAAEFMQ